MDPLLHFLPGEEGKGSAVGLGLRLSVAVPIGSLLSIPFDVRYGWRSSRTIPRPYVDNLCLLLVDGVLTTEQPLTSAHDPEKKPGARGILGLNVGRARSRESAPEASIRNRGMGSRGKPDGARRASLAHKAACKIKAGRWISEKRLAYAPGPILGRGERRSMSLYQNQVCRWVAPR